MSVCVCNELNMQHRTEKNLNISAVVMDILLKFHIMFLREHNNNCDDDDDGETFRCIMFSVCDVLSFTFTFIAFIQSVRRVKFFTEKRENPNPKTFEKRRSSVVV